MITFLPYADFDKSAKCLDYRRLGRQRIEAKMILEIIEGRASSYKRWNNHPAVRMWRLYPNALRHYYNVIICEWENRGYKNNLPLLLPAGNIYFPPWVGGLIHRSHQSNLVRKFPDYYRKYFPDVPDNLPYFWPTVRHIVR
jgi:hypothetical protein